MKNISTSFSLVWRRGCSRGCFLNGVESAEVSRGMFSLFFFFFLIPLVRDFCLLLWDDGGMAVCVCVGVCVDVCCRSRAGQKL